jgi:hypothetical protein
VLIVIAKAGTVELDIKIPPIYISNRHELGQNMKAKVSHYEFSPFSLVADIEHLSVPAFHQFLKI